MFVIDVSTDCSFVATVLHLAILDDSALFGLSVRSIQ